MQRQPCSHCAWKRRIPPVPGGRHRYKSCAPALRCRRRIAAQCCRCAHGSCRQRCCALLRQKGWDFRLRWYPVKRGRCWPRCGRPGSPRWCRPRRGYSPARSSGKKGCNCAHILPWCGSTPQAPRPRPSGRRLRYPHRSHPPFPSARRRPVPGGRPPSAQ